VDPFFVPLVWLAGAAGLAAWKLRSHRRLARQWRTAAEAFGLTRIQEGPELIVFRRITGWSDALHVQISEYHRGRNDQGTQISVVGQGPLGSLAVSPETMGTEIEKRLITQEVDTGDPHFDTRFFVRGEPGVVHARLGGETRRRIECLHDFARLMIADGEVRAEINNARVDEDLAEALRLILDVARALWLELDIGRALAENVTHDPLATVRLKNLRILIQDYRSHPGAEGALEAACADTDPEVRLRAALARGGAGRDVLLRLVEGGGNDALIAEAARALGAHLGVERTAVLLERALRTDCVLTVRACVESLGRCGSAAIDSLAALLKRDELDVAVHAARALGATDSSAAEPPLIAALQRDAVEIRVGAASALGRIGSVAAVLPLQEAAAKPPRDREVDHAVRQAIAEIQGRINGAAEGQVSLVSADAGKISITESGGNVSLSPDSGGKTPAGDLK
jgi:hypothetical protein